MLKRFLKPIHLPSRADWGVLILRVGISILMLTHGFSKFNKVLNGDFTFGDPLGVGESTSLLLTVGAEFFCSMLLILGLASRLVLIPLIFTMSVVIFMVKAGEPVKEKELALLFLIPYVTLFFTGPGKYSLDKKLF